jgi:hypothetical protein
MGWRASRWAKGYGYVNRRGVLVIPGPFEDAGEFSEGLARVSVKGRDGYIDTAGAIVIAPRFDGAMPFVGGLALVVNGDLWSDIDRRGRVVLHDAFRTSTLPPLEKH